MDKLDQNNKERKCAQLFRIDDICDKMRNEEQVYKLIKLLNKNGISPLLGIVPCVKDPNITENQSKFRLEDLKSLIRKDKVEIALHGYSHQYSKNRRRFIFKKKSEFAGMSLQKQRERIHEGIKKIEKRMGVKPIKYFFAPAHSYDRNTLNVLSELGMINVDGISLYPFVYKKVIHIPQQKNYVSEKCLFFSKGIFVNHFHPSSISDKVLHDVKEFIKKNKGNLVNFDEILPYINRYILIGKRRFLSNLIFVGIFRAKSLTYKIKESKAIKTILFPIYKSLEMRGYGGLIGFVKGAFKFLFFFCLKIKYGFNKWHISPIEWRVYALETVKIANAIIKKNNLTKTVEIGCGLGEILERVNCQSKKGYDTDPYVINAARKLFRCIDFKVGTFQDVAEKNIDILITTNFMHEIPPNKLKKYYEMVIKKNKIKYIILDNVNYRFYHNFDEILKDQNFKKTIESKDLGHGRKVMVYESSLK